MRKGRIAWLIGLGIILLISIYIAVSYNKLVGLEEDVNKKWAEVNATYQRRLNLVPTLVAVVQGVSEFESATLQDVVAARDKAASVTVSSSEPSAENYEQLIKAQDEVANSANRVIAVIENYPTLRATEAFLGLQTQLEGTERRIKFAHKDFNDAVANYNVAVRSSTTGIAAKLFGFKVKQGFTADVGADKAVEIQF